MECPENDNFAVVTYTPTGKKVQGLPAYDLIMLSKSTGEKRVFPECIGLDIDSFDEADFQCCEMLQ